MKKEEERFCHLIAGHISAAKAFLYGGFVDETHEYLLKAYNETCKRLGLPQVNHEGFDLKEEKP